MSNSENKMSDSDFFSLCGLPGNAGAFRYRRTKRIDRETAISIAHYLTELPPEDKLNPAAMANHITAFC